MNANLTISVAYRGASIHTLQATRTETQTSATKRCRARGEANQSPDMSIHIKIMSNSKLFSCPFTSFWY